MYFAQFNALRNSRSRNSWQKGENGMKINKEELKRLAEKPDNELWGEILAMAKSHGYNLPSNPPKHEDIERIRRALTGSEKISLTEAAKIMNSYKKGNNR